MKVPITTFALAGLALLFSSVASAGITLGGTRIIYPQKLKETSIMVKNDGDKDIMVQSWVDPDATSPGQDVPFALTPALSRLGAKKQQSLRVFYSGQGLPSDKESVFWLSVQEIPQMSEEENTLQIAVRQRIKLFYRPTGLPGSQEESVNQLKWKMIGEGGQLWLLADNPSPYHISFGSVSLKLAGKPYAVQAKMLAPGAQGKFLVTGASAASSQTKAVVEFNSIDDYGAPKLNTMEVSG